MASVAPVTDSWRREKEREGERGKGESETKYILCVPKNSLGMLEIAFISFTLGPCTHQKSTRVIKTMYAGISTVICACSKQHEQQ